MAYHERGDPLEGCFKRAETRRLPQDHLRTMTLYCCQHGRHVGTAANAVSEWDLVWGYAPATLYSSTSFRRTPTPPGFAWGTRHSPTVRS